MKSGFRRVTLEVPTLLIAESSNGKAAEEEVERSDIIVGSSLPLLFSFLLASLGWGRYHKDSLTSFARLSSCESSATRGCIPWYFLESEVIFFRKCSVAGGVGKGSWADGKGTWSWVSRMDTEVSSLLRCNKPVLVLTLSLSWPLTWDMQKYRQ
jgi:hypothetical protein